MGKNNDQEYKRPLFGIALIACFIGSVFLCWSGLHKTFPPAEAAAPRRSETLRIQPSPAAEPAEVSHDAEKSIAPADRLAIGGLFIGVGPSWDSTILRLVRDRPDLAISLDEAVRLQSLYSRLCLERANIEVSLSRVSPIDPNKNLVEIPAYPKAAQELLSRFRAESQRLLFDNGRTQKFLSVIEPMFASENSNLGRQPQKLLITRQEDSSGFYTIARELQSVSPDGVVLGSSTVFSWVKLENPLNFSGLQPLFPKGKN